MIPVETAARAWVEPAGKRRRKRRSRYEGWRSTRFGERVLVFDTETTTDRTQRLLYGWFRTYVNGGLAEEGLIVAEDLSPKDLEIINRYARRERVPVYTREAFVDEIFYPEVYGLGALCVGFNLPFDLTRIAIHAGQGRGKNASKFYIELSRRVRWPRLHIESASARAAFIGFTAKKLPAAWEKPFFRGRFLDLSTVVRAFTGVPYTLAKACEQFGTADRKSSTDDLGIVSEDALRYGRHDVLVTWQLYEKVIEEYEHHPFASLANERERPYNCLPITQIYSAASIAKAYLSLMCIRPLLEKQPRISRTMLGRAAAAYYGGRAEVRVRRLGVPVTVLDFTSMYPTEFSLQGLQGLLIAKQLKFRSVTSWARDFLANVTLEALYDPSVWRQLSCLVRIRPNGDVLPVRMRQRASDTFTIAVTPFYSHTDQWYTMADLVAAKILGNGTIPHVLEAIRVEPTLPDDGLMATQLRGSIELDPMGPIFETVVEQRQIAKRAKGD
jgi:hypothetical protein